MTSTAAEFWTDQTSVVFTSFYGWTPETWGTVGWSNQARRDNLLREVSDPFITVAYVTGSKTFGDPTLKGKIAGFYLLSHEIGDRDEFTHPCQHELMPKKWRFSVRALRAFSYLPEHRIVFKDFDDGLFARARPISSWGEVLTDPNLIFRLRNTPWVEVDIYSRSSSKANYEQLSKETGLVKAGPFNGGGYVVSPTLLDQGWQLYILRLKGDASAFLGYEALGRKIYKIGLSRSPERRRLDFQHAIPRGAFIWEVERTNDSSRISCYAAFAAGEAGEYAMKKHLASCAEHLGGEFYLATQDQIDKAWELGHSAAKAFCEKA